MEQFLHLNSSVGLNLFTVNFGGVNRTSVRMLMDGGLVFCQNTTWKYTFINVYRVIELLQESSLNLFEDVYMLIVGLHPS